MTAGGRHLAALGVGAALLTSAGCGSSGEKEGAPLPQADVAAIVQRLDEVERRFDDGTDNGNPGACKDIENDSYKAIDATIAGLPEDVDPDVRSALEDSLAKLQELTREGCSDVEETRTEEETTPQEPVPEPTVPQEPVPEPTDTQETVPDQEKPKKNKPENGNGNTNPGGTEAPESNGGGQPAPQVEEGEE